MMMERRAHTRPVAYRRRDLFRAASERVPFGCAEAVLGPNSASARGAVRHGRVVVGQHQHRGVEGRRSAGQQVRGPHRPFEPFVNRVRARQRDRNERSDKGETAPGHFCRQRARFGWKKPPVAQLSAGVAGRRDFVEHLRRRSGCRRRFELEHAPRTGCICDPDHRKSRSFWRATSYASRAASTSRRLDTSATGTSHHES